MSEQPSVRRGSRKPQEQETGCSQVSAATTTIVPIVPGAASCHERLCISLPRGGRGRAAGMAQPSGQGRAPRSARPRGGWRLPGAGGGRRCFPR